MKRIKQAGKTVRLPPLALRMIQDLRASMEQATTVNGVPIKPVGRLNDGEVLSWGLALACTMMNPRLIVADREKLHQNLDKHITERLAALGEATPEQRRAMLELLVAGSCEFSPYDTTAPLRAAPPEGETPS